MIWQDVGIMVIQWAALIALLPTVWSKDKPPLSTSLFTGGLMLALALIFSTLSFWSSTISAFSVGVLWLFIGFQKYQIDKQRSMVTEKK